MQKTTDGETFYTPSGLEDVGSTLWVNTLVGYFVGPKLPYNAVNRLAHIVWAVKGLKDVILQDNDVYFFRFQTSKHLEDILDRRH